jgi:ComF family protein
MYCRKSSQAGKTHAYCKREGGVDACMCAFYYNTALKHIITSIKYRLVTDAFKELFSLLGTSFITSLAEWELEDEHVFLQPIPLHPRRQRERGFNQASIISHHLSSYLHIPVVSVLQRRKATRAQAQLSHELRSSNMQGAFCIAPGGQIGAGIYILVDDVVTTGSTISEASRALKEAGAREVWCISRAKG